MYVCAGAQDSQKGAMDPLELGVQVVVRYLTWIMGIILGPSAGAASTLDC